jgi:hypothetical protein
VKRGFIDEGTVTVPQIGDQDQFKQDNQLKTEGVLQNTGKGNANVGTNIASPVNDPPPIRTWAGRTVCPLAHLRDYITFKLSIIKDTSYNFTDGMDPLASMMTTSHDALYFHEILREPDKMKFINTMRDKINNHNKNSSWVPTSR